MLLICKGIKFAINWIIGGLFILELGFLVVSLIKLANLRNRIEGLLGKKIKSKKVKNAAPLQYFSQYTSELVLNWDEFAEFCKKYQDDSIFVAIFSLLIQLFPLLGILGTVAGLYYAMNSNQGLQNAQDMYEGVRLALSSTIFGIIAAVILKIGDVLLTALFINFIDDGIERYKDTYNEVKGKALGEKVR